MSDKTGQRPSVRCHDEKENDCEGNIQIFELRIIAVIDEKSAEERKEIPLTELDIAVANLLRTTNQEITLCMRHCIEAFGNGTLSNHAVPIKSRA